MQLRFAHLRYIIMVLLLALALSACAAPAPPSAGGEESAPAQSGQAEAPAKQGGFVIGVSNTLVGNGWREQMICSIKAEARASGVVDRLVIINRNAGPTEQIADLESLISQGVDAIIFNPTDRDALNAVIESGADQGIVMVAVDQAVSSPKAYVATNDQYMYAKLGAEWLFEKLGGKGKVVEMRGIDGVPADTDRHNGFLDALKNYPEIEVVAEVFTGWDPSVGAQQALDIITTMEIDGIWTSGIDYPVVEQFIAANKPFVPIVGADNNGFIKQLIELHDDGLVGAAVTNPPAIGAVGTSIAIDALLGKNPERVVTLTPKVFSTDNVEELEALYAPDQPPGWSTYVNIPPYTHYQGKEDVIACKGPGE